MKSPRFPLLVVVVLVGLTFSLAAASILHHDFEKDESGWIAVGGSGTVRPTHAPDNVKSGKSALEFEYTAAPTGFAVAILPLSGINAVGMKGIRFWLKTDSAAAIAVVLSEQEPGGGRYSSIVWSPAKQWQRIELTPADFGPSEGPNDPKDANGKLDIDRLQAVGLVDVSQMFAGAPSNPDVPIAIDPHVGKHAIYIDDFELLDSNLAKPGRTSESEGVAIDRFEHPFLSWLTLGGARLSLDASGKTIAAPALQAEYRQTEDRFVVLTRPLGILDLRKTNRLSFDIASQKPAELVLSLEERSPGMKRGPRYNATIEVPGGGKAAHREVSLAAFEPDENGAKDSNGKLDLDRVKTLSILDVTAAYAHEAAENTLWIGNIQAVTRP